MGRTRIKTRDNRRRWSGNGSKTKKLKKKKVKLYERACTRLEFYSFFPTFIRIL